MIDRARLKKVVELDTTKFHEKFKYFEKTKVKYSDEKDEIYEVKCHKYRYQGITVIYSVETNTLKVDGRLMSIGYITNKYDNYDDFIIPKYDIVEDTHTYSKSGHIDLVGNTALIAEDVYDKIININELLEKLTGHRFNIESFEVMYIEICINVDVESQERVRQYLKLFNRIFGLKANNKVYKNFVHKRHQDGIWIDPATSFYVKTNTDYVHHRKKNYIVNFYNKHDELISQRDGKGNRLKKKVNPADINATKSILRFEVQVGYEYKRTLYKRTERYKTSKEIDEILERTCRNNHIKMYLYDFMDEKLCQSIIVEKYNFFISTDMVNDFYSYDVAIKKINSSDVLTKEERKKLKKHLLAVAQRNSKKESRYMINQCTVLMNKLGMNYWTIPNDYGLDSLPNPMVLLKQKIEDTNKAFEKRILEEMSL